MGNIYVLETAAAKAISAYVVLNRKGENVAIIRAHFGNSRVLVNVHDNKAGFQHGTASGYGYDKFTAALRGLTIDGHELSDHCGARIKPPNGARVFPSNYKPRKGYTLANYCTVDAATGNRLDSYHWRNLAVAQWRAATGAGADEWPGDDYDLRHRASVLATEAEQRGETVSGYADCYRESGLKYLSAIGYRVIQVI